MHVLNPCSPYTLQLPENRYGGGGTWEAMGSVVATGGTLGPAEVAGHFKECHFAFIYFMWSDQQRTGLGLGEYHISALSHQSGDSLRLL